MKSLLKIIKEAEKKKIAIGHFNVSSLEQLQAIAHVGARLRVPVIVGVSEGERDYLGIHHIRDFIASYNMERGNKGPHLYLNADHTHSYEKVRDATRAGCDAVLFDAGRLPLEENIGETKKAVAIARHINPKVILEGEMGYLGSSSEIFNHIPEGAIITKENFTKPEDAVRFVESTRVDLLAPAVGNIHGMSLNEPNPRLDIDRIRAIRKAVGIPLVLHGGSGILDEDFSSAIHAGVSIIHISTELRLAWRKGIEEALQKNPNEVAPHKLAIIAVQKIEEVLEQRLRLFNGL